MALQNSETVETATQTEIHLQDRPLAGAPHPERPFHWKLYICEAFATAVLMICGIIAVTFILAPGSPLAPLFQTHPAIAIALCGCCFGLSGSIAAFTPFGKVSGAHVNSSVTLAFFLSGKMKWIDAIGYVIAQILGALLGTGIIYATGFVDATWGAWTQAVKYAITLPAVNVPVWVPLVSEALVTGLLICMIYFLAGHPSLKRWTPWAGGLFFLVMNPLTAWISGNSVNMPRSLGPAFFSSDWAGFWIYILGPFAGSAVAVACIKFNLLGKLRIEEARIVNFGHHGRVPFFTNPEKKAGPPPLAT